MGSETESKDLEVKKAHTRTRSKQKQDKEEGKGGSTSLNVTSESITLSTSHNDAVDKFSNGTVTSGKKGRGKKTLQTLADSHNETTENNEATDMDETRKTRQGKRSASKKVSAQNETNARDCIPKRVKKDCAMVDEKEEQQIDDEEGNNDPKKPKKPSKRQLKREKAEQRESLKKEATRLEATDKALNYVSKWKHARSEWKFEKLRQIWLMDNLLDDKLIPDEIFPTVLEYFEGCKGMAREQLLKKGMDVIRKQEENEEATTEGAEESIEYKRARQLLQAMPTET